jgi:hypothetical protein
VAVASIGNCQVAGIECPGGLDVNGSGIHGGIRFSGEAVEHIQTGLCRCAIVVFRRGCLAGGFIGLKCCLAGDLNRTAWNFFRYPVIMGR